jgi:hypothetical protein
VLLRLGTLSQRLIPLEPGGGCREPSLAALDGRETAPLPLFSGAALAERRLPSAGLAFVKLPLTLVSGVLAVVGHVLAVVGHVLAVVGHVLALVGLLLAVIGNPVAFIRDPVAIVGEPVALVASSLLPGTLPPACGSILPVG